ncbi:MAG: hypothetical protein AAGF12_18695, partial [Myxococcota bacterium]
QELAHPSILTHGPSYQLYFSGRQAARWATGLFASEELIFWRVLSETDPVLAGGSAAADALGIGSVDVASNGEALEAIVEGRPGGAAGLFRTSRRGRGELLQ